VDLLVIRMILFGKLFCCDAGDGGGYCWLGKCLSQSDNPRGVLKLSKYYHFSITNNE
jgi:hypothetical protein